MAQLIWYPVTRIAVTTIGGHSVTIQITRGRNAKFSAQAWRAVPTTNTERRIAKCVRRSFEEAEAAILDKATAAISAYNLEALRAGKGIF